MSGRRPPTWPSGRWRSLVALILSKFVIVAALTLGLAAMASGTSADDAVAGGAILLIAGFAPFTLLRLAPIVESAAIAHLEGMSRRPFRAASRAGSRWRPLRPRIRRPGSCFRGCDRRAAPAGPVACAGGPAPSGPARTTRPPSEGSGTDG